VLMISGRGHAAQDTVRSVRLLREHSLSIGLQLMPGLPGDSRETFAATVEAVIGLQPDFVRIYPALVIKDTLLERLYRDGRYTPLLLDDAVAICADAMTNFEKVGIQVIRVGLQPSEELERPGTIVAGPYHAAFRQLVQSSLLLARMRGILDQRPSPCSDASLRVNPRDLSSAIGQKRRNIHLLRQEFGLRTISFETDPAVPRGRVRSHHACADNPPEV
jgi:histone acetyltransferase (RNA polymerase elongator complex component)